MLPLSSSPPRTTAHGSLREELDRRAGKVQSDAVVRVTLLVR